MEIGEWLDKLGSWGSTRKLRQSRSDNCVQTVIAMALGLSVENVESIAGTTGRMTVDETLNLLNTLGVHCRPVASSLVADFWPVFYKRHGSRRLKGLGFALPKQPDKPGHAFYISGSSMYDPATGESAGLSESSLRQLDWLALLPVQMGEISLPETAKKPRGAKGKHKAKGK